VSGDGEVDVVLDGDGVADAGPEPKVNVPEPTP
jgi:hypothetical protein